MILDCAETPNRHNDICKSTGAVILSEWVAEQANQSSIPIKPVSKCACLCVRACVRACVSAGGRAGGRACGRAGVQASVQTASVYTCAREEG